MRDFIWIQVQSARKFFSKMWEVRIGYVWNSSIFISVFHRILDFKNGAEFPFRPLFLFVPCKVVNWQDKRVF